MRKISLIIAAFMIMGTVPGWCLVPMADSFVDNHTKNSTLRPVQDTGKIYGAVNHQIDTSLDKIPVIKSRSVIIDPVEKLVKDSVDATKSLINGTWDLLTFKSMRTKKEA